MTMSRGRSSGKWTAAGAAGNVTGDDDGNDLVAISGDPDDYDGDYAGGYMLCPNSILLYYLIALLLTFMLL